MELGWRQEEVIIKIPKEQDWENYKLDLDAKSAYKNIFGKSNSEMLPLYKNHVLSRSEDISWMPIKPFQYYILGFRDFVLARNFGFYESSDAASSFLLLVLNKLEEQPEFVLPIFSELGSAIEFVATNQSLYKARLDIYGDFLELNRRINACVKEHS
jgi:hypothetical protein